MQRALQENPFQCQDHSPEQFQKGDPVTITLSSVSPAQTEVKIHLKYRRANHSESYQSIEMISRDGKYTADIPASYTDSPYPLIYFFEIEEHHNRAWMYPGFEKNLSNQPYYVIRHS
jgi:hypothetical protein